MVEILWADISVVGEDGYAKLLAKASPDRQVRAGRYLKTEDKVRCVVADALIRYAVGRALGLSEFSVVCDANGKPYVQGQEGFFFNLSHSGRWVVLAYGDGPVGIDVQNVEGDLARAEKVCRLFSPEEADFVLGAQGQERSERFYEVWTAKESYLKYLGVGLRKSLDSFSVLPDGDRLGVRFSRSARGEYHLTLCAGEPVSDMAWQTAPELLRELYDHGRP